MWWLDCIFGTFNWRLDTVPKTGLYAGIMQACCDTAFDYAHQRKQFGTPIGEFQLIQAKMADMYTMLNACRWVLGNIDTVHD
jgi:alkylation response protein AidB-like acyl-CoA dehydrogenase